MWVNDKEREREIEKRECVCRNMCIPLFLPPLRVIFLITFIKQDTPLQQLCLILISEF